MVLGDMLPCRALKVVTERLNVRVQTHATKKASIIKFKGVFKRRERPHGENRRARGFLRTTARVQNETEPPGPREGRDLPGVPVW